MIRPQGQDIQRPEVPLAGLRFCNAIVAAAVALALGAAPVAGAEVSSIATYVVNLGGTIIASARFALHDTGSAYTLSLDSKITGIAQLIASGTAKVDSSGVSNGAGLRSEAFKLLTSSGGEDFSVKVDYAGGEVAAFVVDPPIINNIDRVPVERKHLHGVNDMLAAFVLKGGKLDKSLCNHRAQIFTGIERFDIAMRYAKDDIATSKRTGYQGPVVLCNIRYTPISGHFTTSEITTYLADSDRILIWYAPLLQTGYFIPYRVLLTTTMGDLSMVLTSVGE